MQYFTSVVKNNSFTEGAEECFISQSAISQQIMALENELGVKLLVREKRKFTITPAGEYFYRQALALLDDVDRVKRQTMRIASENKNEIRIGYLRSCGVSELTTALAMFSEQHPDTLIHVEKGTHEELYQMLLSDQIDIAINDQRRAFSDEYRNYELITAYSFVILNRKNRLSNLECLSPEELKKVPCIIVTSKQQQETEKEYYKTIYGLGDEYILAENLEEARLLIAGNRGYFITENCLQELEENEYTKRIPLCRHEKQIEKKYCAFWKKSNHSEKLEKFAHLLYEQLHL